MDKLENALYVSLQEHINKNNYKTFKTLLKDIKELADDSPNDKVKEIYTNLK
jgi:hypothetical protein